MTDTDSSSDDYHLRFQVASPEFNEAQDRVHTEAMAQLRTALAAGQSWLEASRGLKVVDAGFKELILADFLKVLLAERHFQNGERLKGIAKELGVPMELLLSLKEAMIREVIDSSQQAYRLSQTPQPD
ncbi:MAG: hypothetical protein HQL91_07860 [Magnetococcales bacterium]|nr:hypothetical protein [Magnetococcales bacterium]